MELYHLQDFTELYRRMLIIYLKELQDIYASSNARFDIITKCLCDFCLSFTMSVYGVKEMLLFASSIINIKELCMVICKSQFIIGSLQRNKLYFTGENPTTRYQSKTFTVQYYQFVNYIMSRVFQTTLDMIVYERTK